MKKTSLIKVVFQDIITHKNKYINSRTGAEFEDWFKTILKSNGFVQIVQKSKTKSSIKEIADAEKFSLPETQKLWNKIKKQILLKNSIEVVKNPYQKIYDTYIFQPYGSQNFPDFLIFTKSNVLPIEIKYTTDFKKDIHSLRPMWNSNMPKPNAIYIYGVAGNILTFFKGSSILEQDTRQALLDFFEGIDKKEIKLDEKLKQLKNNFGIYPYVRKAYEHKKNKSTFIDVNGKRVIESYFSENALKREKEVIDFLNEL